MGLLTGCPYQLIAHTVIYVWLCMQITQATASDLSFDEIEWTSERTIIVNKLALYLCSAERIESKVCPFSVLQDLQLILNRQLQPDRAVVCACGTLKLIRINVKPITVLLLLQRLALEKSAAKRVFCALSINTDIMNGKPLIWSLFSLEFN